MATKTNSLIVDAFLELSKEMSIEKISITDIVEKCGISRQTFYYHFKDVDEMLTWAFKNETDKIKKEIKNYSSFKEAIFLYQNFFDKYGQFLKACLNTKYFIFVYSLVYDSCFDFVKEFFIIVKNKKFDEKLEFAINIYVYSFIGFIIKELKKDKPDFIGMINNINQNL